jgi:predicted DNA-binding transcriptional regulator YafY
VLLASLVLQFGPDAVVLSPDVLREEIVGRLEAVGG